MAFLKRMFGGGSSEPAPKPRAVAMPQESGAERTASTLDTLERRVMVLEKKIDEENTKAKACLAKKDQKGAMRCLKRKKLYEQQVDTLQKQVTNLEQMQVESQNAATNRDVMEAQRAIVNDMRRNAPTVEEVERMQDDLNDALDNHKDVTNILGESLAGGVEDDDVEDELAALMQEQEDEQFMTKVNAVDVKVPTGPVADGKITQPTPVEAEADEDDDALAELTAELNA